MDQIGNMAGKAWRGVATPFVGVLKESKFYEKGVLTPEEFVMAGEQLAYRCPTWKWEAGDEKLKSANLPTTQQFLMTRGVPCGKRLAELEQRDAAEEVEVIYIYIHIYIYIYIYIYIA